MDHHKTASELTNSESYELRQTISRMICSSCAHEYSTTEGISRCPYDNALLAPVLDDPFLGQVIQDKYEIISVIGVGGFAHVYEARQISLDRKVAIKILGAHLVSNMNTVKRFEQEAKIVSQLVHPNIVAIHDYGLCPQPFLVMEYLEGQTLEKIVRGNPASAEFAVRILSQVCDAMQLAHDHGCVHRDLKPSNIMLSTDQNGIELVKILDFGVAKLNYEAMESVSGLTRSGETMGSPPYMSPEQCQGRQPDPRSDVYSLGCVMYEILSGDKPFSAKNAVELMHKHMVQPPPEILHRHPNLKIPKAMEYIIIQAMSKNPEDRYQSMFDFKEDLKAVFELTPEQFKQRMLKRRKRKKPAGALILAVSSASVLLLAGSLSIFFGQATNGPHSKKSKAGETKQNNPAFLKVMSISKNLANEGNLEQAINLANKIVSDYPDAAEAYANLAQIRLAYAKDRQVRSGKISENLFNKAIENANNALEKDAFNIAAYQTRLEAHLRTGKLEDANADLVKLKALDSKSRTTLLLNALFLSSSNKSQQALAVLKDAESIKTGLAGDENTDSELLTELKIKIQKQDLSSNKAL